MRGRGVLSEKKQIQQGLVDVARRQLDSAQDARQFLVREAELDQNESLDATDLSLSDTANDMADSYEEAVAKAEVDLAAAQALDMSETDAVRPGAVVVFDGQHYVVGVASEAFDVDGVSYEGISLGSPVYALIEGKRAGDSFSFNGSDHVLDEVN